MQKTILLVSLILLLTGCQNKKIADISYTREGEFPEIVIHTASGFPLKISTGKTGSLYFETEKGKSYISGSVIEVESNEARFIVKWTLQDREITLSVNRDEDVIQLSLTSEPADDILGWGFGVAAREDEYFTGLFERTVDGDQKESWKKGITTGMDLRGQQADMIIKPTLSLYCPFYFSSAGYGLFTEGTWPGRYDFCKSENERVLIEFEGPSFQGRIYSSDNPAEIVKAHSLYVGPTIVPPEWAFLPWRWRDNHENRETYYEGTTVHAPYNSQVVEDILMMHALDIPCGVYWVDRPWAVGTHGYADFTWDPERLPNAKKMIDWLHSRDIRFLLWIAPWVTGDMMQEARAQDFTQPMKHTHHSVDSSNAALLDFTNPEACVWWQEKGIEKMLKQGVDGFKLDRSEETVPESRDIILADGRTAREVRNDYPVMYVKTVNESCRKIHGDDFVLIPRAGYTGSSRYSGFWGGDIGSPPEGLRAAIIAVQRSAVIGFPIWGSDIGGYWQGDLDREVLARWLAFGCFNPIMEVGPTEDRAPWDMDSVPHYDTELLAIWRMYATIHTQMAGYSHQLVKEAANTGMPPVRPLFLVYPDQEEAWTEWQNYLYGTDILVHAIWKKGTQTASVYLPKGERWKDAWDSKMIYKGGQTIQIETPLYKIPLFIREGSGIDLGDLSSFYLECIRKVENQPDLTQLEKLIE